MQDYRKRAEIIERLADRGIDFADLAEAASLPDADPFDLLCHVAFNAPFQTRGQRVRRVKANERKFFERYEPEARAVLEELLDKYAEHGPKGFKIPGILNVPPLSQHGTRQDIYKLFGGATAPSPSSRRVAKPALCRMNPIGIV